MYRGVIDSNSKIVQSSLNWYLDASQLRSYGGSGTTFTNLYGTGKNGTLTNSPVFVTTNGGGFRFDGNGAYIDMGNSPVSNGVYSKSNMSFCIWLYLPYTFFLGSRNICFGGNYGGANFGPQMYVAASTPGGVFTALVYWLIKRDQGDVATISNSINFNTFYNFVGSYDGSYLRLYKNGVLVSTSGYFPSLIFSGNNFNVGGYSADQSFFNGYIYNVIMYNKALSDAEVLQNYNVQKSRFGL